MLHDRQQSDVAGEDWPFISDYHPDESDTLIVVLFEYTESFTSYSFYG